MNVPPAKVSPWLFHPEIKSTQNPVEFVTDILKSKCLEVLRGPLPYQLKPKIAEWKIENGVLRLNVQFLVKPEVERILLKISENSSDVNNLRLIAKLAESDLQDFFGRPVFIIISVYRLGKEPSRKTIVQKQTDNNLVFH